MTYHQDCTMDSLDLAKLWLLATAHLSLKRLASD